MTASSLGLGFMVAAGIAGLSYAAGALSRGGALAAIIVGGVTFGAGGPLAAVLLILFFVSSSALSRINVRSKRKLAGQFEKGTRRDQGQVLANGGVAAFLALGYGLSLDPLFLAGAAGALAAANADTWATEIGVLSRSRPRLITNGRPVEPGTSGAVSVVGFLAALGGAGLIGLAAALGTKSAAVLPIVTLAGVLGTTIDSLLGATAQAIYYCPSCQKETERHPLHACGTATVHRRGWSWLRNDEVNLVASLAGAAAAMIWIRFG